MRHVQALFSGIGSRRGGSRTAVTLGVILAVALATLPTAAFAQDPNQVTGLTAEQRHGHTQLRWTPVPGATDYQIERTPVDGDGQPTAAGAVVGVWRPNRTTAPEAPAFADAGFHPGDRFAWRVRARNGTTELPYSEPVVATTLPQWGDPNVAGQSLRTQWETTQAAQFTSDTEEYAYTAALDQASDRVRVVEIGRTVQNRPINMFIIGYPAPPATSAEISDSPTALVNCNVHGNEPSSREACLIMARELAFAEDARTLDILSHTTVLMVPSINGDGRAANTRGNVSGTDLNRDHSLLTQPETLAFARMLRDYTPQAAFDGHEFGNSAAGDLPVLPPRHLNVAQPIFDQSQNLVEGWMYEQGSADGWWYCPYGCEGGGAIGLSQETILRNTMGLKNTLGSLLEARSSGGPTRPNEGNTQFNRRRKTYSAIYTYHEFLDFHRANQAAIAEAIEESVAFQVSNASPIVWRGSRTIEPYPAPHPGESPPPQEPPTGVLEDPPCGYLLTESQYTGVRTDGPTPLTATTLAQRIDAHGWTVEAADDGYYVPLAQPQRGLIPLLLDAEAAEEWTAAQRVPCAPEVAVSPASLSAEVTEGRRTDAGLTIANTQEAAGHNLRWEITEAETDCSSPSDLGWLEVSRASGVTAPDSTSDATVTFTAGSLAAPARRSGLLCVSSNDADSPVVAVPVELQVTYPFAGFLAPTANPPALNVTSPGKSTPMKFSLGGDRGMAFLAAGSPQSQGLDCTTLAPFGALEGTEPAGSSGLQFQAKTATYTYVWKTAAAWKGTCRQFVMTLDDGSEHRAYFRFR